MVADLLLDKRVQVIGTGREETSELGFWIIHQQRHVPLAVILHHNRFVVGDQLGKQANDKQDAKEPQRDTCTAVSFKRRQSAQGNRREA